ncbi:MAG: ribonuclease PH [Planctomycetes bacterium]|nr:ribonuclease PH [Planctomycetota bacterium]
MKRDRPADECRPITFQRGIVDQSDGSVLVTCGRTKVLCTVSVQDGVPQWMSGQGRAWLTAEYSMLPGSTRSRKVRDGRVGGRIDARSLEIQRLIGRSLRAVLDVEALPEITLWVDCDVINADGGTRTTAVNGACIALHDALVALQRKGRLKAASWPMTDLVAAVSVGLVRGELLVDLDYREDVVADVDLNVVRRGDGRLVEVQGTAEGRSFTDDELRAMLDRSARACEAIVTRQREVIASEPASANGGEAR